MILKIVVELVSKDEIAVMFQPFEKEYCSKILQHSDNILKLIEITAQSSILKDGYSLENLAFFVDTIETTLNNTFYTKSCVYIKSKLFSNIDIRQSMREHAEEIKF